MVGRGIARRRSGPGRTVGVIIEAPPATGRGETVADLHALDRPYAHERLRQHGIQLIEHGFTQTGGHAEHLHPDDAAERVALAAYGTDQRLPRFHGGLTRSAVRTGRRARHVFRRKSRGGHTADFQRAGTHRNPLRREQRAGNGPAGHTGGGFAGRGTPPAPEVAHAVLGVIGHIRVPRTPDRRQRPVIAGALVGVLDLEADGRSRGRAFKNAGQQPDSVRLLARGPGRAAAGTPPVELLLEQFLREGDARRATVHHAAERRAVGFPVGGQTKKTSESISAHECSFLRVTPAIKTRFVFGVQRRTPKRSMTFFASASAAARFPPFTDGAVPYYRYKFTLRTGTSVPSAKTSAQKDIC